ncbi:MAG TPA: hypothetical protein VF175_06130 [Lacipirellula sp.]
MYRHPRVRLALGTSIAALTIGATTAFAQIPPGYITSFEAGGATEVTYPAGYVTGQLFLQDNWVGGDRFPRVQTADEIATELTTAGLNVGQTVHTGDQALLVAKVDTNVEPSGYLVRNTINGLTTENNVTLDFWARPLTSGLGADPAGTPAGNGKTIGERQGNNFFGIMDSRSGSEERRVVAVRFGVDTVGPNPYENVVERHIDFGSATAGSAVWVKSGLLWEADTWYNFRFDMDFTAKTYDFFVNGLKVNNDPIQFYHTDAIDAGKFFVSRGTNQAGSIIDDVNIQATSNFPPPLVANADFDDDGDVDGNDFLAWQRNVGTASGAELGDGDANDDGAVDANDLTVWKTRVSAGSSVAAIPEPTSVVIGSFMLVGLAAAGRRANKA